MFFIKAAFWLTIVVALIPIRSGDLPEGEQAVSTMETVGLAQSVVSDAMSFCERNAQTCETGTHLVSQMGAKAREGARIAFNWLDNRYGPQTEITEEPQAGLDRVETGSLD